MNLHAFPLIHSVPIINYLELGIGLQRRDYPRSILVRLVRTFHNGITWEGSFDSRIYNVISTLVERNYKILFHVFTHTTLILVNAWSVLIRFHFLHTPFVESAR